MSMPAIGGGRVYMAYPNSNGNRKHYLACFELKTGKELWSHEIAGDIITAPVIDKGRVFLRHPRRDALLLQGRRAAGLAGGEECDLGAGRAAATSATSAVAIRRR